MEEIISAELTQEALRLFGTEDYDSVLAVLPAYDGAVKEFRQREQVIRKKYIKGKDE